MTQTATTFPHPIPEFAGLRPNPFISMINRMLVVQFDGFDGTPRTLA